MTKRHNDEPPVAAGRPSKRAKLQALLFTRAALGAALWTLGGAGEPKLPPFHGE